MKEAQLKAHHCGGKETIQSAHDKQRTDEEANGRGSFFSLVRTDGELQGMEYGL
jgi:hypothetical protein